MPLAGTRVRRLDSILKRKELTMTQSTIITIKKGPLLTIMVLGAFISILNQTIMSVALPELMHDLQVSASTGQWLTTGYMLVNGVMIPLTAYFMERFTTRQLFLSSMILFTVGTIVCAVAPGFGILLTGRMIQAAGAGIIMPLLMNVVFILFPVEKRGTAMGLIGFAIIVAPAVGPSLTGFVLEHAHWRILFYGMLPIALIITAISFFLLKNLTERSMPKLDVVSAIISTIGFGGLLYGVSVAGAKGWNSLEAWIMMVVGFVALIFFTRRQWHSDKPFLNLRVFQYPIFTLTSIINVFITIVMFADMILLPLYLQNTRGFTPLESGLLMLPGAVIMGIMSPITGWIFDKVGARWLSIIGLIIAIASTWEFMHLTNTTSYSFLVWMSTIRRFGIAMLMMPIVTAGLNQLPKHLISHGNAVSNTLRQVSGAIGTALLVTIMTTGATRYFIDLAAVNTAGLTKEALEIEAMIMGINDAYLAVICFAAVGLLLSFFIKRVVSSEEKSTHGKAKAN